MKLENPATARENHSPRKHSSSSRSLKSWLGIFIFAIAWPFAAVWLHAHQIIDNVTETLTCWWLCLPAAVFGSIYFWIGYKSQSLWRTALALPAAVLSAIVAITIIVGSRAYSDQMFTYWIMKRIPIETRQEMAAEIYRQANLLGPKDEISLVQSNLPKGFNLLGRDDEYRQGMIMNNENGAGALVEYGDKNRHWGFLVGPAYMNLYENKSKLFPVWRTMRGFSQDKVGENISFLMLC
jgi:hypothetical protein